MNNRYLQAVCLALGLSVSMLSFGPGVERANAVARVVRPVTPWQVIHPFMQPLTDYGSGHRGVDVAARSGKAIFAPFSGRISWVGWVGTRRTIALTSFSGLVFEAEPACSKLGRGDDVIGGKPFARVCGSVGYTSHCAPTLCAHLGIRNSAGYFSIEALLGDLSPSRLGPTG